MADWSKPFIDSPSDWTDDNIGDHYGRRGTLISGLALFTIASVIGGFASDPYLLISARALQGLGAAFIAPNVMSTVTTLFAEGKERNRALGMLGSVSAVGFLMGLILGGLLTSLLNWRWVFFINVPSPIVGRSTLLAYSSTGGPIGSTGKCLF